MRYSELNFPRLLNLQVLEGFLPEEKIMEIIMCYADKGRKMRRIVLPSKRCLKKVIIYALGKKYCGDFDRIMKILSGDLFFSQRGLDRQKIMKLYSQREKEIEKENKNVQD